MKADNYSKHPKITALVIQVEEGWIEAQVPKEFIQSKIYMKD